MFGMLGKFLDNLAYKLPSLPPAMRCSLSVLVISPIWCLHATHSYPPYFVAVYAAPWLSLILTRGWKMITHCICS